MSDQPTLADEGDELPAHNGPGMIDARSGASALVAKVARAMSEAAEVRKSEYNADQKFSYASAEAILAAVRGPLLAQGVILVQRPVTYQSEEIAAKSGTKGTRVTVGLDFEFTDGDATYTVAGWRGQGQDYSDRAYSKAYTNAVKTFVKAQWLLPTEHDDSEKNPTPENVGTRWPSWALEADTDRKRETITLLGPVFGEQVVRDVCTAIANTWGHFPDGLGAFAKALVEMSAHRAAAAQAAGEPAEDTADDAAGAPSPVASPGPAGKATPAGSTPTPSADAEAQLVERWARDATDDVLLRVANAAGTDADPVRVAAAQAEAVRRESIRDAQHEDTGE